MAHTPRTLCLLALATGLGASARAQEQPQEAAAATEAAPAPEAEAAAPAAPADPLAEADALTEKGGVKNIKASIPIYEKLQAADPKSYELAWKTAKAHRNYANESRKQKIDGWKKLCATEGKLGMKYGALAIELNPKGVEGHMWYGLSVGTYSDGVSILTALSEGLKDKTQNAFETSYKLDKKYNDGGPILSLGRFWAVLPWPLKDRAKAFTYLREFQKLYPNNLEGKLYLAEALIDEGGSDNKSEAKALLEAVTKSSTPLFRDKAKDLLAKL